RREGKTGAIPVRSAAGALEQSARACCINGSGVARIYYERINNAASQAAAVGPAPHCAVVRAFENADVSSYKETPRIAGVNGDVKGWQTTRKAPACASIGALEQTTASRRIDGRGVQRVNRERLDISVGQSIFKF